MTPVINIHNTDADCVCILWNFEILYNKHNNWYLDLLYLEL